MNDAAWSVVAAGFIVGVAGGAGIVALKVLKWWDDRNDPS